jgi:heme ABC exporter ATP-binding subunit CcmA
MDPTSQFLPLRTEGLTKRFGRLTAVDGVSLEVGAGERLAIFGRNGAGKTTFLRLLVGLARPDRGQVTFGAHVLSHHRPEIHQGIGFLSHNSLLYADLSVWENLSFAARLFGVEASSDRIEHSLGRVGMFEWRREKVRHLSAGMERRVAVARALLHQPSILVLDEPFAGLDGASIRLLQGILENHRSGGGTILLTTHRREEGVRDTTRVIIFDRGRIAYDAARDQETFADLNENYGRYVEGKP